MQLYETLADGILKDQIVIGIKDNYVRDRLLRTSQEGDDLMLNKAIDICRAAEQTVTHSGCYVNLRQHLHLNAYHLLFSYLTTKLLVLL